MLGFLFYFSLIFLPIFGQIIHESYKDNDWSDIHEEVIPLIVFSGIFGVILMSIVSVIDPEDGMERYDTKTPIYSMYNSDDMSGTYLLLAGSIDDDHYYTYLKMNKYGNYVKDRIEETYDGEVEIKTYEDSTEGKPVVIRYWERHWNEGFFTFDYDDRILLRTVIQIPEGSLKREISIK